MDINSTVVERIKKTREGKKIAQSAIAKAVCLSASAYSRIESGESAITLNILAQIAQAMQVDIAYLLDIEERTVVNNNNNQILQQGTYHTLNIQLSRDQFESIKDVFSSKQTQQ